MGSSRGGGVVTLLSIEYYIEKEHKIRNLMVLILLI